MDWMRNIDVKSKKHFLRIYPSTITPRIFWEIKGILNRFCIVNTINSVSTSPAVHPFWEFYI